MFQCLNVKLNNNNNNNEIIIEIDRRRIRLKEDDEEEEEMAATIRSARHAWMNYATILYCLNYSFHFISFHSFIH